LRRLLAVLSVLIISSVGVFEPTAAVPGVIRTLSVTGADVTMFPAFDAATTRYAATTSAATAGTIQVTATTSDPQGLVLVEGRPTSSPTSSVAGLSAGDEVSVIIEDGAGRTAYSVMYLPSGFPTMTVTVDEPGQQPGLIALTLNAFNFAAPQPSFETIVDRNGVPVWVTPSDGSTLDLKQQPTGELTVSRPTTVPGHTGTSLVTLDDAFREATRRDVRSPLTNTDAHDSVRMTDGSTILIGYEPNAITGKTDATVQKLDAAGNDVFTWTSAPYAAETMRPDMADYAHVNSVVSVEDDDVIVSFRHLSAAYRIATVAHDGYAPGDVIWKFGGRDSDFTFVDDPYASGPCAQHTVSELSDGHLLVFDNGTDLNCVNPTDPSQPAVFRGKTRITEYALDTSVVPHTATLVWSYDPADKYSWFAGSARRMANGNTLIAWAADRAALSTEISTSKQKVWEITTSTPPAPLLKYATYRSALIPTLPDTIEPTIDPGLPDNAQYLVGDTVAPAYRCADRGGSSLRSCSVTGLTSGRLDTTTVGAHTWGVTAQDGDGNITTITRRYTVRAAVGQPDGLIRKAGSTTWKGGNVYGAATYQTVRQRAPRRHTTSAYLKVQNDGERADGFLLHVTGRTGRY
jgi:hypothetical protein